MWPGLTWRGLSFKWNLFTFPTSGRARVILAPHAPSSSFLHSIPLNTCQNVCSALKGLWGTAWVVIKELVSPVVLP